MDAVSWVALRRVIDCLVYGAEEWDGHGVTDGLAMLRLFDCLGHGLQSGTEIMTYSVYDWGLISGTEYIGLMGREGVYAPNDGVVAVLASWRGCTSWEALFLPHGEDALDWQDARRDGDGRTRGGME